MSRNASSQNKIGSKPFISTWRTTNTSSGSSANNQVKLPLVSTGKYNFTVIWGDGTSNLITVHNQAEVTHTYAATGDYTIQIIGTLIGWQFNNTGDRLKLLTITQWGALKFLDVSATEADSKGYFYGCTNLTLNTVNDTPNFKSVTQLSSILRSVNPSLVTIDKINKWDVSKVQVFRSSLQNLFSFNDNIGNWNMRSATNLSYMFASFGTFGQFNNGSSDSIKNWDVSNVNNFSYTFISQKEFNREIGLWNMAKARTLLYMLGIGIDTTSNNFGKFNNAGSDSIKNWNLSSLTPGQNALYATFNSQKFFNADIGDWDVSGVDDFRYLFGSRSTVGMAFNNGGSPSIGNWDTSNGRFFSFMFESNNAFNQNIGSWDTSKALDMIYMLGSRSPMTPPMVFNNGGSTSIDSWNTALVGDMSNLFRNNAGFNQALSSWNISNAFYLANFFQNTSISVVNYSNTLIGWASRPVKPNIAVNMGTVKYNSSAIAARAILTSAPNNWTITDGGLLV